MQTSTLAASAEAAISACFFLRASVCAACILRCNKTHRRRQRCAEILKSQLAAWLTIQNDYIADF